MKISCLVPVYNTNPSHLFECLYSLSKQTVKADEIVVVDDGSTLNETILALELALTLFDIKLFRLNTNCGTSVALNEGHKLCSNELIAIMGSDDIAFPTRFEKQINFINSNPACNFVGTSLFGFRDEDPFRTPMFTLKHKPIWNSPGFNQPTIFCVNHGTIMYRKSIVLNYPYNYQHRRAQDVHLWARLLKDGYTFHNIPDVLYAYRYRHKR
jgi:amylovoran biosynthesis glycosyltransferase AmsE